MEKNNLSLFVLILHFSLLVLRLKKQEGASYIEVSLSGGGVSKDKEKAATGEVGGS